MASRTGASPIRARAAVAIVPVQPTVAIGATKRTAAVPTTAQASRRRNAHGPTGVAVGRRTGLLLVRVATARATVVATVSPQVLTRLATA